MHKLRIALFIAVFILPLAVTNGHAAEADGNGATDRQTDKESKSETVIFAKVGDTVITMTDYQFAFLRAAKEKFYHGKPAQGKVAGLQREVGQQLVDDVLLVKEAKRRSIKPDASFINQQVKVLDEKNKGNPRWQKNREKLISRFKKFFEEREMIKRLKKQVINEIPYLNEQELRKYYKENPKLFTEPEKMRVWVIILKVDPGASQLVWEETKHRAAKIISRLRKGEDFETLAKQYSDDKSSAKGGDMGFIHRGVIAGRAQAEADKLAEGQFSKEPILLLEGYVIIKRGGVKHAKLHKFEDVIARARNLVKRELEKSTWENLKVELSKGVPVEVNEKIYLPLNDSEKNKVESGKK